MPRTGASWTVSCCAEVNLAKERTTGRPPIPQRPVIEQPCRQRRACRRVRQWFRCVFEDLGSTNGTTATGSRSRSTCFKAVTWSKSQVSLKFLADGAARIRKSI